MQPRRIFETVLYTDDLDAAQRFYEKAIGLELLDRGENMAVFRCGEGALLLFDRARARLAGRGVPAHGTDGPGHVAFAMPEGTIDGWRRQLESSGVEIEMEVAWETGGRSLYVRDPAGNSVELAPPTLWGGAWDFG